MADWLLWWKNVIHTITVLRQSDCFLMEERRICKNVFLSGGNKSEISTWVLETLQVLLACEKFLVTLTLYLQTNICLSPSNSSPCPLPVVQMETYCNQMASQSWIAFTSIVCKSQGIKIPRWNRYKLTILTIVHENYSKLDEISLSLI